MGLESNKHNWEASACICMTARSIFANRRGKSPKRHVPYMFHICLYMFSDVAASPMTYPCIFWSHVPNVSIPRGIFHLLGHLLGPQNGDPFVKCRPSNDRWRDRREGAKKKWTSRNDGDIPWIYDMAGWHQSSGWWHDPQLQWILQLV